MTARASLQASWCWRSSPRFISVRLLLDWMQGWHSTPGRSWMVRSSRLVCGHGASLAQCFRKSEDSPVHSPSGAYALWGLALVHFMQAWRSEPGTTHSRRAIVLFGLITAQAAIGIWTLLAQVQLHVALAHQGMAFIVLFFAVAHWRAAKGPYAKPTEIAVES